MFQSWMRCVVELDDVYGGVGWCVCRAVANGPVGPAMAGPIIEPVIFFLIFFFLFNFFLRPDQ